MSVHPFLTLTAALLAALLAALPVATAQAQVKAAPPPWEELTYALWWGPCPTQQTCHVDWTVRRTERVLQRTGAAGASRRFLSEQELSQLDALVAGAVRQAENCPPPPTDVFDDLTLVDANGAKQRWPVTGCAYVQAANAVKALKDWLAH